MSFSFVNSSSAAGTGVTSLSINVPSGTAVGTFLAVVYAFEGVAAGSGPWIIPNTGQFDAAHIGPSEGWMQACWQAPSAAGVGIEVWVAIYASGTHTIAALTTSQNVVAACGAWNGEYNPSRLITPATVRLEPTLQVTGNQPAAPSVNANVGELLLACGGDLMTGAGFGSPAGFTNRVDAARSGAGTVEATIADAVATIAAPTGPITFPNAAASSSTRGSTATLVVVPTPVGASVGPVLDVPMPADLDLGDGWTLRVTAIDPVTGAVVAGVNVSNLAVAFEAVGDFDTADLEVDDWLLVPGQGA